MIIGTGIDIVEVGRIADSIDNFGDKFLNRVYTTLEKKYCESRKEKITSLAGRFAAKEAVLKMLGTGLSNNSWQDIEIKNDLQGKPEVFLSGQALSHCEKIGIKKVHLTISHEKNYAVAQAIGEGD